MSMRTADTLLDDSRLDVEANCDQGGTALTWLVGLSADQLAPIAAVLVRRGAKTTHAIPPVEGMQIDEVSQEQGTAYHLS